MKKKPYVLSLLADLETPVSTYLKLAQGPYSYLFESLPTDEKLGRYSIIGLPCRQIVKIYGHSIQIEMESKITETLEVSDPLAWIKTFQQGFEVTALEHLDLRYSGGLVGYFAYDAVRYMEPRLGTATQKDLIATPDILLMVSEEVVIFDNKTHQLHIITHVDPSLPDAEKIAHDRLRTIQKKLAQPLTPVTTSLTKQNSVETKSQLDFAEYEHKLEKIKQYIIDGDVMQVVFARAISRPFTAPAFDLYRALRYTNPSPYLYYLNLNDHHIAGSSPEILTRLEQGVVTVKPLAGTRPRGKTAAEDAALVADLLSDPKEIAEHLMLIDLARNDIGRIAQAGSVQVTEKMVVEHFSHVMHITSTVIGQLKPELKALDALSATFPAGTLSGAPKVRAMEIIEELETTKRGIYGGAIGYLGWNGNMDMAITIRTAIIKDEVLYTQAGGGIVYDSQAQSEWQETVNKSNAVLRAAELAEQGLEV